MGTFRISRRIALRFPYLVLPALLLLLLTPATGICEMFTDDFEDPATYLGIAPDPPTKWRQVGVSTSSSFTTDTGSDGIGSAVRLGDTDQEFHLPALAADFAQYYDLSSVVLHAQVKPNTAFGSGGIGFGVYDDSGENISAGIAAGLSYDSVDLQWWFELLDIDEYDTASQTIQAKPVNINLGDFYLMTMERAGDYVTATLDTIDGPVTLGGVPDLPIDVAGIVVWVNNLGDGSSEASYSFDDFSMTAEPDNRHMVFGDVTMLGDTATDELFPQWSKDGKWLTYIARDDMDTSKWNLWVRQIDPLGSADKRTLNADNVYVYAAPVFSPDNSHVIFTAVSEPSAEYPSGVFDVKRASASGELAVDTLLPFESGVGYQSGDLSLQGNLLLGIKHSMTILQANIYAIEVNDDGSIVPEAEMKLLTAFGEWIARPYDPHFDPAGDRVVFQRFLTPPKGMDLWMLSGVQAILDDPITAPTDYNDERLTLLADGVNGQATGRFSGDGLRVYYCEDTNGAFDFLAPVYNPSMTWADMMSDTHWEIFSVNPDAPSDKQRLNYYRPYNQGILAAYPDGTKLAFVSDNHDDGDGVVDADLYIVSLVTQGSIVAADGGTIGDGSGSEMVVPAGSLDVDTDITIETPFPGDIPSPETLPDDLQNIALAREIESSEEVTIDPDNPPWLTIRYTDEEIAGLDETSLFIYVYTESAGSWEKIGYCLDNPVEDCTIRDPVENTVSAPLPHFSMFCLSGALEGTMPVIGSFKPPLTDETDFGLQYGTTLPVKFDVRTPGGEFLPDEPIEAVVADSAPNRIATFVRGDGSDCIRVDEAAGHYIFNLHSKDYGLQDGSTYTIVILWNGIPIGEIDFVVDYTKGTGRGKKK